MILLFACVAPAEDKSGSETGEETASDETGGRETDSGDSAGETDTATDSDDPADPDVDVAIVGAGPAGLAAAVTAMEAGATVRVFERTDTWGGSDGPRRLMMFAGSAEQTAVGIPDSPEQLLAEWRSFTGGDEKDPWVQAFAHGAVPYVRDWLAGFGVTFSPPFSDGSSGPTARIHGMQGDRTTSDHLYERLPDGVVQFGAEAVEILHDKAGVYGVTWRDVATGEEHDLHARAVVVATGGFLRDLERVRAEAPALMDADLRYASWEGADGNGLALLESLGARTENLDAIGLYAHGAPHPEEPLEEATTGSAPLLMWFNGEGRRFCDESAQNSFPNGWARALQPGGEAWFLLDAALAGSTQFQDYALVDYTVEDLLAAGVAVEAESVEALATTLGAEALPEEWEGFVDFASGATTTDPWRPPEARAPPPVTPPFYAVPIAVAVAKSFGGVDVDLDGGVLDLDGRPIPGLYAAGELTGMAGGTLVGEYGFTGSMSAVILSGRVAGAAAAR